MIVPAHTYVATWLAVLSNCGAVVVPVEPDPASMLILTSTRIEENITEKTKVIVPVHLYGHPCDMTDLLDIASPSFNFNHRGQRTGSWRKMERKDDRQFWEIAMLLAFIQLKISAPWAMAVQSSTDRMTSLPTCRQYRNYGFERKN